MRATGKTTGTEDLSDATDEVMSLHDSSDESLNMNEDTFGLGLSLGEPTLDSWVGVKI